MTDQTSSVTAAPAQKELPMPSAMNEGYGPIFSFLFRILFSRVRFPVETRDRIRALAREGTVIYVMRSRSFISYLYFNYACLMFGLPLARFVNGVRTTLFMPVSKVGEYQKKKVRGFTGTPFEEETRLQFLTELGESSLLFLRGDHEPQAEGAYQAQYIKALVALQRKHDKPIFLFPQMLIFDREPASQEKSLLDILLGSRDNPSAIRMLLIFLRRHREAFVKAGEPVNLQQFVNEHANEKDEVIAKKVRWSILHYLAREQQVIAGPLKKSPMRIREQVLRDPRLRQVIEAISAETGQPKGHLASRTLELLREIAGDQKMFWLEIVNWLADFLWARIRMRQVVEESGVESLRKQMLHNPVVLCPSHKSHADYIILSQVLLRYDMVPPYIAAGINLSFWPMGPVFRGCGAFFMRRTFKGDPLYQAVFRAYIKRLLLDHHVTEFFIEGGRSRTGKVLQPKLGLLSMYVDAFLEGASHDVIFQPVGLTYERMMEEKSYVKELGGGEKQKEDITALIKGGSVLIERMGNMYIRFGAPISLVDFAKSRGLGAQNLDDEQRRELIRMLAQRIVHDIADNHVVAPAHLASFVLLSDREGACSPEAFRHRAEIIARYIRKRHPQCLSSSLDDLDAALAKSIARYSKQKNLELVRKGAAQVLRVPPGRRLQLDYYKNNLMHFTAGRAMFAMALRAFRYQPAAPGDIFETVSFLRTLFHLEFVVDTDDCLANDWKQELDSAVEDGWIEISPDGLIHPQKNKLDEMETFSASIENFLESYYVTVRVLESLVNKPCDRKELILRSLELSKTLLRTGELRFPEACSKVILDNAVNFLEDSGRIAEIPVEPGSRKKYPDLSLMGDFSGAARRNTFAHQLLWLMGRAERPASPVSNPGQESWPANPPANGSENTPHPPQK
ncbi:MAG: Glycerol-3-phosphate acyltransferase [Myxococcota bacterium]|nr:Glycerol-3-phosphate acyltransferase [Myxococcota bacterium]